MSEQKLSDKHVEIYTKLEKIVGKEYISDDPSVLVVHSRDQSPFANLNRVTPGFVVLPENTEHIQHIMKISNEYKIPVVIQNFIFYLWLKTIWCAKVNFFPKQLFQKLFKAKKF